MLAAVSAIQAKIIRLAQRLAFAGNGEPMTAIDKSSSRTRRAEQIVSPDTLKGRRHDPKTIGLGLILN